MTDDQGRTALHEAAYNGQLEVVQYLDKKYPQLWNMTDARGCTALHCAAYNGHQEVVQYLNEQHPELVDKKSTSGNTAQDLAKEKGHIAVFAELSGSGSTRTLKQILEDDENLPKGVSLPADMSNVLCDFTGSLFGVAQEDGEQRSKEQPLDRERLETRIQDYIDWSTTNASGTRFLSRFSHFYHGESGRERANNLLAVVQDKDKADSDVLNAVKKAVRDSGEAKHSLSRYLIGALSKTDTVGNDMSSDACAQLKTAWLTPE